MSQKFLYVTMPDSSVWKVPVEMIVVNRAKYYATVDSAGDEHTYDAIFEHEYRYTADSPDAILDWAANNMNWSDAAARAQKVPSPEKVLSDEEFQEGWVNGDKKIVEE